VIKRHKGQLASDRTSCRSPLANQMRLILHTAAYWLMLKVRNAITKPQPLARRWLAQVVAGYFAYHAVPTNSAALSVFRYHVAVLCTGNCAGAARERMWCGSGGRPWTERRPRRGRPRPSTVPVPMSCRQRCWEACPSVRHPRRGDAGAGHARKRREQRALAKSLRGKFRALRRRRCSAFVASFGLACKRRRRQLSE
jgi:hypothetical protein